MKANILIIDDDQSKLDSLELILRTLDQNIIKCKSGHEGLRALLANEVAIILLDVNMPVLDGFETAKLIRNRVKTSGIPIIFITAFHTGELDVSKGYSLGAVDYIFFPFNETFLLAKLRVFLEIYFLRKAEQLQTQELAEINNKLLTTNERLAESETSLQMAQQIAKMGDWEFDIVNNKTRWSENCFVLYGFKPFEIEPSFEYFRSRAHPDDLHLINKAFVKIKKNKAPVEIEMRILLPDDTVKWICNKVVPVYKDNKLIMLKGVNIDISELKQLGEDTLRNLEREKELNMLKSRFISVISHEFRTPLTGIQSSVQLLERYGDKWDKEKKQKFFNTIYNSIRFTNLLLDDVSIIGKDESGKISFNPTLCIIEEICRQAFEDIKAVFGKSNMINFSIRPETIKTFADESLLRHILNNLLSNAVKYSGHEKQIDFSAIADNDDIIFTINDNGIGIPEEDMKHIFDSFHRASNVESIKGTGLGLSIVKRCVEIHEGTIEIKSKLNKGTTVVVKIPYKKPDMK